MPTLKLTAKEASALKAKRARDKAWNLAMMAVVDKLKPRLKDADPIQSAIVHACLQDVRRLMR